MKAWRKKVKAPVPTTPNPQYDAEAAAKAFAPKDSSKKNKKGNNKKS